MTTPRLTFLYPAFFQLSRNLESGPSRHVLTALHSPRKRLAGPRCQRRLQSGQTQRYGPAAEPTLPPQPPQRPEQELLPALPLSEFPSTSSSSILAERPPPVEAFSQNAEDADGDANPGKEQLKAMPDAAEPAGRSGPESDAMTQLAAPTDRPLDRVLQLEAPSGTKTAARRPPHLQTPPYVHHFDTFTLVNDLEKGGFSQDQSVTIMKAVRSLLADNMEIAKDGIVSKSDIENESYLFRAACSELRTEIEHLRHRTISRQRSDLAHLQHDADILNQRVTQELQTLRDELKGLFDDRKMNVREEQRRADVAIQELNRRIAVGLLSDGKSSVEGLRWFLARRAALAIGIAAIVTLGAIRYTTYMSHQQDVAREKHAKDMRSAEAQTDPSLGSYLGGADSDAVIASASSRTGAGQQGVSYVSLG